VSQIREASDSGITVLAEMESERLVIESPLPTLLTVTKDINTPRLPSFADKMKARKAAIETWGAAELADVAELTNFGLKGSPTRLNKVVIPSEEGRKGQVFRGSPDDSAVKVADALQALGMLGSAK